MQANIASILLGHLLLLDTMQKAKNTGFNYKMQLPIELC